jgi:predicted metal-dependent phosphoesterase TrpH
MHVHTCYSNDSSITLEQLVSYGKKQGLHGAAVTDHDTLEGALKLASRTDFLIIPGIEVHSSEGHIIGLNIKETVPSKLTPSETIDRIHSAGGIAVACHPFGLFKGGLGKRTTRDFDAVEVINSSAMPFSYSVRQNLKIASNLKKPRVAGTDAHYAPEIGCAYTLVDANNDVDDVIRAVKEGSCQPYGRAIPLSIRVERMFERKRRI